MFFKYLKIIAEITKWEMTDDTLEFYDLELSTIGYEVINVALKKIARSGGIKGRFPLIDEIENLALGKEPSTPGEADEFESVTAVNAIMGAISRFGWINGSDMEAFKKEKEIRVAITELGWSVVENLGGWNEVCKAVTYDNMSTKLAQMRESGRALAKRHRQGLPYPSPAQYLPVPEGTLPEASSQFSVDNLMALYFEKAKDQEKRVES